MVVVQVGRDNNKFCDRAFTRLCRPTLLRLASPVSVTVTLSHAASAAAVAAGGECWPLTVLYEKNIMFITKNEFKRHHND
jgi:hypothetical protein